MAVDDHFLSHVEKTKASSEKAEEQEKKMILIPSVFYRPALHFPINPVSHHRNPISYFWLSQLEVDFYHLTVPVS